MTIITAIVSPSARPKAIIAPATMPGRIAGKMILTRAISREKPSASAVISYCVRATRIDS